MRKKRLAVLICVTTTFLAFALFSQFGNAATTMEYEISALVDEGIVVVSNERIYNLGVLQNFYDHANWGIEDEIQIMVNPYTRMAREYELVFSEGRFLLYSDIGSNREYNYTIGEYQRLFRTFRNNEIQFVLECEQNERYVLLGYSTN